MQYAYDTEIVVSSDHDHHNDDYWDIFPEHAKVDYRRKHNIIVLKLL